MLSLCHTEDWSSITNAVTVTPAPQSQTPSTSSVARPSGSRDGQWHWAQALGISVHLKTSNPVPASAPSITRLCRAAASIDTSGQEGLPHFMQKSLLSPSCATEMPVTEGLQKDFNASISTTQTKAAILKDGLVNNV